MIKKIIQHKDKLILMQLAIFQILVSFATNFIVVKKIGFGNELDIFYLAMAVYLFLTTSVNWPISAVLTPILIENSDRRIEGSLFINIFAISLIIVLIVFSTINIWSNFIFVNYIGKISFDTIKDIQIIFLITFFIESLNILFLSTMQKRNEYIKINIINLITAIIGLLFVLYTIDIYGVYSAVLGQLLIRSSIFIILFIYLLNIIKIDFIFRREILILLWGRMKYIFIGSFYFRLNDLVDKFIASYLTSGFLSLVSFIQKLYEASNTVINSSITAPTITKFSILIKEKKYSILKKILVNYLILLFVINSISLIIVYFLGEKIFLYFFSNRIEEELVNILFITLITIFIICYTQTMGKIMQNLLLSLKAEKEITKYDVVSFTIAIIIKIILTYNFLITGFLISFILAELIKVFFKYYLVNNKLKFIGIIK